MKKLIKKILKEESEQKYKIDRYTFDDFIVYVGKNAYSNQLLTMEASEDGDLWFHTKKYPGTHVVLSLNGKEPTKESIIFAAQKAKENSKGSEKDNVEVVYCYIRDVFRTEDMRLGQVDVHPSKLKEIVV